MFGVTRVRARPVIERGRDPSRAGRVGLLQAHAARCAGAATGGRRSPLRRPRRGSRPRCRARSGCRSPSPRTRPTAPRRARAPSPSAARTTRRHHDADDQRVERVQARHRRVRVRREGDEGRRVVDRRVRRERVGEAGVGEHPRRRRRQEHVADEPDQVPEDQRVAEAREAVVRLEVDPEQRDPDDRELREPVRDRGRLDQEAGALDERAAASARTSSARLRWKSMIHCAVRERVRDAAAVGEPARALVGEVEADPERELEPEVRPAARETTWCVLPSRRSRSRRFYPPM